VFQAISVLAARPAIFTRSGVAVILGVSLALIPGPLRGVAVPAMHGAPKKRVRESAIPANMDQRFAGTEGLTVPKGLLVILFIIKRTLQFPGQILLMAL
jgi:hypothetical protein